MTTNLQIKLVKSLHQKKYREIHGLFLCEGRKLVEELIKAEDHHILFIFATEEYLERYPMDHPKLDVVTISQMKTMSMLSTTPEILAAVDLPKQRTVRNDGRVALYLDGISDPGNLGTILRTAEWYGLHTIFVSEDSVDAYNPKVVQASMGSIFRIQVIPVALEVLLTHQKYAQIVVADMDGDPLSDFEPKYPTLLVMGSESQGIRQDLSKHNISKRTILNQGQGESLNVGIATAIFLQQIAGK